MTNPLLEHGLDAAAAKALAAERHWRSLTGVCVTAAEQHLVNAAADAWAAVERAVALRPDTTGIRHQVLLVDNALATIDGIHANTPTYTTGNARESAAEARAVLTEILRYVEGTSTPREGEPRAEQGHPPGRNP